jgi:hypothetical protein
VDTRQPTFPAYVTTRSPGRARHPDSNCAPSIVIGSRCRSTRHAIRARKACPTQAAQSLRLGALPDQHWRAYLTGLYSQQDTRFIIQPVPLSDDPDYCDADGRCGYPAAADEPLPASVRHQ